MIEDLRHLPKQNELDCGTLFWVSLIVCLLVI